METEANRIKALRKNKGLTQGELAEAIGVSTVTISGAENGNKISVALNEHIAKYFKVSTEWLATGAGEKPKGLVIPIERGLVESPWKDEVYQRMKTENERLEREINRLWAMINHLTGGKLPKENFLNASAKGGESAKVVHMAPNRAGAQVGA